MGLFNRKSSTPAVNKSANSRKHAAIVSVQPSRDAEQASFRQQPLANGSSGPPNLEQYRIPEPPDSRTDPVDYLRSIHAVRERSRIILEAAKRNNLTNFRVDMTKFSDTASYVAAIIKVRGLHDPALAHLTNLVARLCTRLSKHTSSRQMATLRYWRYPKDRSAYGIVATERGCPGKNTPCARSVCCCGVT